MPAFEKMDRKQKAVYWEYQSVNNINEPVFAEPVNLMVRWVNNQRQSSNSQGRPVTTSVDLVADRDLGEGSLLWLAPDNSRHSDTALEQWYGASGSGSHVEDVMEVLTVATTPSLKANWTMYVHGLNFYKREVTNES